MADIEHYLQAATKTGGINISEEAMQEIYTLLDKLYTEDSSIKELLGSETNIFSAKV